MHINIIIYLCDYVVMWHGWARQEAVTLAFYYICGSVIPVHMLPAWTGRVTWPLVYTAGTNLIWEALYSYGLGPVK